MPVADDDFHAVVVPRENVIRLAGTAESAGYVLSLPEARIQNLVKLVRQVLPTWTLDPAKHAFFLTARLRLPPGGEAYAAGNKLHLSSERFGGQERGMVEPSQRYRIG